MKSLMARTSSYESSSAASSPGHFHVLKKPPKDEEEEEEDVVVTERRSKQQEAAATIGGFAFGQNLQQGPAAQTSTKKRNSPPAVTRLRSVLIAAIPRRSSRPQGLGSRVVGTIFGHRCGHVHLAFQADARSCPVVLIELSTPTSALVREMSSGVVRIALECERSGVAGVGEKTPARRPCRLVEETLWRAYCNGNNLGYAVRRECGAADWKVLRAVEPVSMGAGVIPGPPRDVCCSSAAAGGAASDMDIMYMRARFERVVGSKDSEAMYMMSPDENGSPELSVYFRRV